MDIQRNDLSQANSLFLRQNGSSPVHWQEWSPEILAHARRNKRIILVSSGYSSCHWCHQMSNETFSDPQVADVLNRWCTCILIDRERRPDIDQYCMDYLVASRGTGGWPLNVFFSPELKPFYAFTFAPAKDDSEHQGILAIITDALQYYRSNSKNISHFSVEWSKPPTTAEHQLDPIKTIIEEYDPIHGGFGSGAKLPPYSTLLFLFYRFCYSPAPEIARILQTTLDAMMCGALQDNVAGGFFRHCSDSSWETPIFEKLLVDQAMQLWVFSLAERIFPGNGYRRAALGVIRCLERDFRIGCVYGSALDSDVCGIEGGAIIWTTDELAQSLNPAQRKILHSAYRFAELPSTSKNYKNDDRLHLIQRFPGSTDSHDTSLVVEHLRNQRAKMPHAQLDRTILADANCLTGIAFTVAARCLNIPRLRQRATEIFFFIQRNMFRDGNINHCFFQNKQSPSYFARDAAAYTLLADTLYEHSFAMQPHYEQAFSSLKKFHTKGKNWIEADSPDFYPIPAASFDFPYPSTQGMIDLVYARHAVRTNNVLPQDHYLPGIQQDFGNIARIIQHGHFLTIYTKQEMNNTPIPANSIVLPGTYLQSGQSNRTLYS